jgi:hypothetical protein
MSTANETNPPVTTPTPAPVPQALAGPPAALVLPVFNRFCAEGEVEPRTKKTVRCLVLRDPKFLVFLDENCSVWWVQDDAYGPDPEHFGEVANRVAELESADTSHLTTQQLVSFRRQVAEGVARILQGSNPNEAHAALDKAAQYIRARHEEWARIWYLSSSLLTAVAACLVALLTWGFRGVIDGPLSPAFRECVMGAGMGGLGAFLSILLRIGRSPIDPSAGKLVHSFEGFARVTAGVVGAVLVTLAFQAKLVLGNFSEPGARLPALLVLGLVAGASERLVPSLIEQVERFQGKGTTKDGEKS